MVRSGTIVRGGGEEERGEEEGGRGGGGGGGGCWVGTRHLMYHHISHVEGELPASV